MHILAIASGKWNFSIPPGLHEMGFLKLWYQKHLMWGKTCSKCCRVWLLTFNLNLTVKVIWKSSLYFNTETDIFNIWYGWMFSDILSHKCPYFNFLFSATQRWVLTWLNITIKIFFYSFTIFVEIFSSKLVGYWYRGDWFFFDDPINKVLQKATLQSARVK